MKLCMYEGYIRNRKQLLTELSIPEEDESTDNESEIILKGFVRWGRELPSHLYGSFSFVIRDAAGGYFCARDAFGIENLYYCLNEDGKFLFSSDIKPIADDPDYNKDLDREALQLYMMFGYPAGEKTLYKGIRKLLPGRYLTLENGKTETHIWFKPEFIPDGTKTADEWASAVEDTFGRILSEDEQNLDMKKCASFLSGGVDSSYLLAMSGIKNAYNMDFEGGSIRESTYAQKTADALGAGLHVLNITADTYLAALPEFVRCMELPVADTAGVAFYIGCRNIEDDIKTVFSGEGSDEFFAGYHVYKRSAELGSRDGPVYVGCDGVMTQTEAVKLLGQNTEYPVDELLKDTPGGRCDPLSRMLLADIALWLEGDILFCAGRAAKVCGKKVILPYADMRMFDLSSAMPSEYKLWGETGKYALRCAAKRRLGEDTAFRKKAGYLVPVSEWFCLPEYRDEIRQVVLGDTSRLFFNEDVLQQYWKQYTEGGSAQFRIVFAVYLFVLWYENVYTSQAAES